MNVMMMPRPPHWITVTQGIGPTVVAIVIGAIAAGIAYRQWQTAHQKLMVDMFDRRIEFFNATLDLVKGYLVRRNVDEAVFGLSDIKMRSRYLFGPRVQLFFDELIADVQNADFLNADGDGEAEQSLAASARLRDFHQRAFPAFGPYLYLANVAADLPRR
jgi:hypothetical protein